MSKWCKRFGAILFVLCLPVVAQAEDVNTSNWVPNVGVLDLPSERPLGDQYSFRCHAGYSVDIRVQSKDDTDNSESCVDLISQVCLKDHGTIAAADDNMTCKYPPTCGYQCPRMTFTCPVTSTNYTLNIRDYGTASATGVDCNKGGGYELFFDMWDVNGNPVSSSTAHLKLALDHQNVPFWCDLYEPGDNGALTNSVPIENTKEETEDLID